MSASPVLDLVLFLKTSTRTKAEKLVEKIRSLLLAPVSVSYVEPVEESRSHFESVLSVSLEATSDKEAMWEALHLLKPLSRVWNVESLEPGAELDFKGTAADTTVPGLEGVEFRVYGPKRSACESS